MLQLEWVQHRPVWVEQWLLPKDKLEALKSLVQEQLELQHIEPSVSSWNSPVFVIKKDSGKWRLLTDLREVNKCIKPMGLLQLGVPCPSMVPKDWPLLVIDLKDCFFTIPLQIKKIHFHCS